MEKIVPVRQLCRRLERFYDIFGSSMKATMGGAAARLHVEPPEKALCRFVIRVAYLLLYRKTRR